MFWKILTALFQMALQTLLSTIQNLRTSFPSDLPIFLMLFFTFLHRCNVFQNLGTHTLGKSRHARKQEDCYWKESAEAAPSDQGLHQGDSSGKADLLPHTWTHLSADSPAPSSRPVQFPCSTSRGPQPGLHTLFFCVSTPIFLSIFSEAATQKPKAMSENKNKRHFWIKGLH